MGVMVMKGYSTLFRSPKLEPNDHMQFSVIATIPPFRKVSYLQERLIITSDTVDSDYIYIFKVQKQN